MGEMERQMGTCPGAGAGAGGWGYATKSKPIK